MRTGSNNTNKLSPQEPIVLYLNGCTCSNNTNKLSPQEQMFSIILTTSVQIIQINLVLKNQNTPTSIGGGSSNNTNKLSPQERCNQQLQSLFCSNNTNKLSPQEHGGLCHT